MIGQLDVAKFAEYGWPVLVIGVLLVWFLPKVIADNREAIKEITADCKDTTQTISNVFASEMRDQREQCREEQAALHAHHERTVEWIMGGRGKSP